MTKRKEKIIENVKVNYQKVWDSNGTCYRKGLSASQKTADTLFNMIRAKGAREKDYYRALWLNTPITRKKRVAFLNLTQSRFIVDKLIKAADININPVRALVNCNTYLLIKK